MKVYRDQPAPLCPGVPWGLPWVPKGRLKISLVQIRFSVGEFGQHMKPSRTLGRMGIRLKRDGLQSLRETTFLVLYQGPTSVGP
jgi:hypothetical protein